MSPYRKNVMVGAVVLGGMIALAWMLIQFGGMLMLPFAPARIHVHLMADRADGISNGSAITYRGVAVGQVDAVRRTPDQIHVSIDASLDRDPPLPGNLRGEIRSQGLIGSGASIVLETTTGRPEGKLAPGQEIEVHFVGLELLPPEFADLAGELRATARQFRESNIVAHLDEQVTKAGQLIESVQSIVADKNLRENLTVSLQNIRTVSEKADRVAGNLETFSGNLEKLSTDAGAAVTDARVTIRETRQQVLDVSRQVSASLAQISKLLDRFQSIAEKVDKGEGTAGELVNDRRLYESLVDTARELSVTVQDLRRLVEQWEQEGVSLKLK